MYLENNHCISLGRFDKNFCDDIIKQGEKIRLETARIQDGNNNNRNSKVSFLKNNSILDNVFINILEQHNKQAKWNFALHDLEPLQYTVYDINDHYDWHIDSHTKPYNNGLIRKISFTLCLNEDYEGGELKLRLYKEYTPKMKKGSVIAFPSIIEHKVTPVTRGIRYTSTMWISGQRFR
jgi:PKHD-type hydroxylase